MIQHRWEPVSLKGYPAAIPALRQTHRFFSGSRAVRVGEPREKWTEHPRPADAMLALASSHLRLQRDLHLDLLHAGTPPDNPLWWLAPHAEELDDHPADAREHLRELVATLRDLDACLAVLSQRESTRKAAIETHQRRVDVARAGTRVFRVHDERERLSRQVDAVYRRAARSGRTLNPVDRNRLNALETAKRRLDAGAGLSRLDPASLTEVTAVLNRLVRRHNRAELRDGLLLTHQMQVVIDRATPSLRQGRPALFVGETGSAKTALAEHIARRRLGRRAEIVSFHGEINVYQLIGRDRLESDGSMSFSAGPVVRAIETGTPLILDEVNAAPAEFLKRLNVILQLRPGDHFPVQEDASRGIRVRPGFCIMATANEKSSRYRGVEVLSAELKNRFGTNIHRIRYPDAGLTFGQVPADGIALAECALADETGELAVRLPEGQLEAFVRAAHASQKIFTGAYGEGPSADHLRSYVSPDRLTDSASPPGLEDTVLSPRLVVAVLEQVRDGLGRVSLTDVLQTWVEAIERPSDRAVMARLLDSHVDSEGVTLLGGRG